VALNPVQGRNWDILAVIKQSNHDLLEAEQCAKRAMVMEHFYADETYAGVAFSMGKYDLASQRLIEARPYLIPFAGDQFNPLELWQQTAERVFSPDSQTRVEFGEWLWKVNYESNTIPEIPLTPILLLTGCAEAYFKVMGDAPPAGVHGSLLSIWGDTEPCRLIYNHPDFMAFAERIGMAKAWKKYGYPDRLQ